MTPRKPSPKKRAPAKKAAKGKTEPKPEKVKRKPGRPPTYTEEAAEEILERLKAGQSLISICESSDSLPPESTVRGWVASGNYPEFAARYAKARELGYLRMADEILGISDDGLNDFVERLKDGASVLVPDREHIMRSRLRVDTRKWLLSKCLPKIFGDKVALTGADGGPIETRQTIDVTKLSTETLKRIREELGGDSDPA